MKEQESYSNKLVVIRGGGDLATGVIHRLHSAGFPVLVLECEEPSAIRRQVALSEAVFDGEAEVEGVTAVRIESIEAIPETLAAGKVPVLVDAAGESIERLKPFAVVDAILAKRNLGTRRDMARLTIGIGPGFIAGRDVDYVIESQRGHSLGRIIDAGEAQANTGIPGDIGGYTSERVVRAGCEGTLKGLVSIGELVTRGQTIARIEGEASSVEVKATLDGILRGLIRDGFEVVQGFKIADIDPRVDEYDNCFLISDKARCIAGSVLELICSKYNERV